MGGEIGHQMCCTTQAAVKLYGVSEDELSALQELPGMIGRPAAAGTKGNLLQISFKLAPIFSPVTVSDTEPVCAAIKRQHAGMSFIIGPVDLFIWIETGSVRCVFPGAGQLKL